MMMTISYTKDPDSLAHMDQDALKKIKNIFKLMRCMCVM